MEIEINKEAYIKSKEMNELFFYNYIFSIEKNTEVKDLKSRAHTKYKETSEKKYANIVSLLKNIFS